MKVQAIVGTAVMAWLVGCSSSSGTGREPLTGAVTPAGEHGMSMTGDMCPMKVPGTTVTPADVEGGVVLVFSTPDVAEVRRRVRRMAEMHDQHDGGGGMRMEGHGGGAGAEHQPEAGAAGHEAGDPGGMMGGGMMMPAATATVEDIEGGARLVLRPKDPAQLEALREHARTRAGRMARGECPMMSPGADAHHPAPPVGEAR